MADGSNIDRPHVFLPSANGVEQADTMLLLHGTGADENDLLELGRRLKPAANLLSPRGLVNENGMNRFFERYPDGTFNEDSIDTAVSDLTRFIQSASHHYGFDSGRVIAVGFSNGANTAAALLVRRPESVAAVIMFGSTIPYRNLMALPDLSGKRIWLANGDHDGYAPVDVSLEWVAKLSASGAEVKFLRHAGGHQISLAHVQEIASDLT